MATSMMKQRLIGAAVLIALGVIFIPMLLTGDGKFLSGDMESNVPPKPMYELEAPKVLPLDKLAGQPSDPVMETAPAATSAENSKTAPASATTAMDSAKPAVKSESQQKTQQQSAVVKSEPVADKPEPETVSKETETPKSDETVSGTQVASKQGVAKVEPKVAPEKATPTTVTADPLKAQAKAEASKPAPIVTGWAVQLGSFSVQKNALNLRDRLRKKGHASFVEEYKRNGKTSYRVRVGPELTRELANELKTKLKAETKLDGFVVEFSGK